VAPITIKKYGNRRLYDTGDSRYVTLDELAAKVRGGADVRVIDAQNGDDLTQATLTQIVLETGHAAKFLPVQLLTQMIRLSDDSLAEFFSRYVTGALDLYLQAKRGVQTISSYNPLTQLPMAASDALARMWMATPFGAGFQQPYPGYPPGGYPSAPSGPMGGPGYPAPPTAAPIAPPIAPAPPEDAPPPAAVVDELSTRDGDVAAMRRELDELKQMMRDSLSREVRDAEPRRKKREP
jgi:polyhydroxyalkanoate synthesis repressor PhaR